MKKSIIIILIGVLALASHGFAQSDSEEIRLPDGKWWQLPKIAKELGLNAEEQKKLDNLFVENRRKMIDLKSNLMKEKFELEQVLEKQELSETACMDRFKKLENARTDLAAERFRFLIETRKILGFDRYQKLKDKFQQRKANYLRRERELNRARKRMPE